MIRAYPKIGKPGLFYLQSERSGETYNNRERIKAVGAHWDTRHWIVTDDQRQQLGIERMIRVAGHHSCGFREETLVPESQAVLGESISVFCGHCDGRSWMRVEDVIDE